MLDNYLDILQQYKDSKLQELFGLLPLPSQWQLQQFANKIDTVNNQTDYLVDLYHYREIPKLLQYDQITKLGEEFKNELNQEGFILMLAKILDIPSSHMPFLINGARILYHEICWQYQIHKINFSAFLNFYFICQQEAKTESEPIFNNDQKSTLKNFEIFKKEKYGFIYAKEQDVTHHQNPIKKIFYCQDQIISLDDLSYQINIYDAQTVELLKTLDCSPKKRKTHIFGANGKKALSKQINILDIYFADSPKVLGACCQDKTISFWTLTNRFSQEYTFSSEEFGLQVQILYLETTKQWITVNRDNTIYQWSFTFLIESNDNKGISFTNQSVSSATLLNFIGPQISSLKEIPTLKKLFICTTEKTIHIWNPIKQQIFTIIEIPSENTSAHSITYSQKLNVIFTAGFDVDIMLWELDEVNEDYNKVGSISIRENSLQLDSTISAIEVFDEYGMLISLDDKGLIRCWDIEQWEIIYRFDLKQFYQTKIQKFIVRQCFIKNTTSQLIRLSQGRFALTTQRINILEFPIGAPRKIKVKFKPRIMQCINSRVYVSSTNELIGFNWNNTYIEEKEILHKQIIFFFIHWDETIVITEDSMLHVVKEKKNKLKTNFLLFEDQHIEGCTYNYEYSHLTCWNKKQCKIMQSQYIAKQLSFSKMRQITLSDEIEKVINCCQRDVIGLLQKNNILSFIQYSSMRIISSVTIEEEIVDFTIFSDYKCLAIITKRKTLFFSHIGFSEFQAKLYISTECPADILKLNYQAVDKIMDIYIPNHFKYKHNDFFKQEEENNTFKYEQQDSDFSILKQINELKQKNEELNIMQSRIPCIQKLQRTVKRIIDMIKKNSVEELRRISQNERLSIPDSNKSTLLDLENNLPRRNAQIMTSFKLDFDSPNVDINKFTYKKSYIFEDFNSQYFFCINQNKILVGNIQAKVIEQFESFLDPYSNKEENTKQFIFFKSNNEIILEYKDAQEVILSNVEVEHNSITPQIINFYDHILLVTFGIDDNLLRFWDITCIQSLKQLIIDKDYLVQKPKQVLAIQKLKEMSDNYINSQELNDIEQIVELRNKQILQTFRYKKKNLGSFFLETPYLQGEYVLTTETKNKWNLKEFNSYFRINQMRETYTLVKKMMKNYQEANKYQIYQQQMQINEKLALQQKMKKSIRIQNKNQDLNIDFQRVPNHFMTQAYQKQDHKDLRSFKYMTERKIIDQEESNEDEKKNKEPIIRQIKKKQIKRMKELQPLVQEEYKIISNEIDHRSEEQMQYEQFDSFLKTAPKKVQQLNKYLNELYFPPFEKEQKQLEIDKKNKKIQQKQIFIQTQKVNNIKLINFNIRASDKEKREFFNNYSFEEIALKQSETLRQYSSQSTERSLTPFKEYLKETRNIKLNNSIKTKEKLKILKTSESLQNIVHGIYQRQNLYGKINQLQSNFQ